MIAGLKFIQTLTEKPSEFRYDLDFDDHNPLYERFGRFQLTGAQYTLSIDNEALDYSGEIGHDILRPNLNLLNHNCHCHRARLVCTAVQSN
jgi:hypothetical protein